MDIDTFNELDKIMKLTYLIEYGTFLKTIEIELSTCNLYKVEEFYVKFKYKTVGASNVEITAFESIIPLNKFISDVDLIELFV